MSAIASYVTSSGQLLSLALTNLGTFVGAVCFLIGAVLLLPERTLEGPADGARAGARPGLLPGLSRRIRSAPSAGCSTRDRMRSVPSAVARCRG